jgi:MFS family permease
MHRSKSNRGWWVVIACALVMFGTWNAVAGFGVFLPVLSREFGWSRGAIAGTTSLQLIIGGTLAFAIGSFTDRYGPRPILIASALITGAGYISCSAITALWQFYLLQGLVLGIGMASIFLVPTTTVSRWFASQRGLALGVLLSFHSVSFITGPPLSAFLINSFGWRTTYLVLGALVWCIALPASAFTRFPEADEATPGQTQGSGHAAATFSKIVADHRIWFLGAAWLCHGFIWMTLTVHLVPYVRDRGVTLEEASLALPLFGVGIIIGRLLFGFFADKLGTKWTFGLCQVLQVITLTWLLTKPSIFVVYFLMAWLGMSAAGSDIGVIKGVAEVFGVRAMGATMGVMNMGWRSGAALGPAMAGFIYDATGAYTIAFALVAALPILSVISLNRGMNMARSGS